MTKDEFIAKYQSLIRVRFDTNELIINPNIRLRKANKPLHEFLSFYVPRYSNEGVWDSRPIEQIIEDGRSQLVQVREVIASPEDWNLIRFTDAGSLSKELWPIPIATDTSTHKTLLLDSNHTVCTLLGAGIDIKIKCIEIIGDELSALGTDLKLMQR
jgi:hypothetical protein